MQKQKDLTEEEWKIILKDLNDIDQLFESWEINAVPMVRKVIKNESK